MARLPRKIGPRLVQGVSPATSDALTAVGSVVVIAQTGGPAYGGGAVGTSFHERGKKRRNLKNPDHLSLIDTHQSEVSRQDPTPYSHTARYAASLNGDGLLQKLRKKLW